MGKKVSGKKEMLGKPANGTDEADILDLSAVDGGTRINGGDGNDLITGANAADRVNAGDGDDTVEGGLGDDILFGGDGSDTAVFSGSIFDYVWSWAKGNTLEVFGADGNDQLKQFEYLQFGDFTYSVYGGNAPVAVLRSAAATEENAALTLDVDLYDFDGDAVTVVSASTTRGTLQLTQDLAATQQSAMGSSEGLQIAFDPGTAFDYLALGQETTEAVTLVIEDSNGNRTTTSYEITVTGTNDGPTLAAGSLAAVEDGAVVTLDLAVLGDDVDSDDDGDSLSYAITGGPDEGSVSISGTVLSFDPGADFQDLAEGETRDVVVEVTATDRHGATATNDVTVTITGTNEIQVTTTLGFDDITEGYGAYVPYGYGGFDWLWVYEAPGIFYQSQAYVLNPDTYLQNTGFEKGNTSPDHVIYFYMDDIYKAVVNDEDGDEFVFVGATLTAENFNGIGETFNLDIIGYNEGVIVQEANVSINELAPTILTFNWDDVDSVQFSSSGPSFYLVVDDFIFA